MEHLDMGEETSGLLTGQDWFPLQDMYSLPASHFDYADHILTDAWQNAAKQSQDVRNQIAWQLTWIKVLNHDYHGAATWLHFVAVLPGLPDHAWANMRGAFIDLWTQLGNTRALTSRAGLPEASLVGTLQPLHVYSLGTFMIKRNKATLPACHSRKAIVLFRYLLTRPQYTASREELIDILWPDASPDRAAHSLHVTVSTLRSYLDDQAESYITFVAGAYAINSNAELFHDCATFVITSDAADHFWRNGDLPHAQAAYIRALTYYQGDFSLIESECIWVTTERERLLTRYLVALEHLGVIWMQHSCYDASIECFQRLLARDEYREDIHCQVMRCFLHQGRRNDALRQYQCCAKALADDLGLEPMLETRQLYESILSGVLTMRHQ